MWRVRVTLKGGGAINVRGECFWNCHMAQEVVMCKWRYKSYGHVLQDHLLENLQEFHPCLYPKFERRGCLSYHIDWRQNSACGPRLEIVSLGREGESGKLITASCVMPGGEGRTR